MAGIARFLEPQGRGSALWFGALCVSSLVYLFVGSSAARAQAAGVVTTSPIFVTHIGQFRPVVQFSIFIRKDGRWTEFLVKSPGAQPGDGVVVNKLPTRWTVVDVRRDAQEIARQMPDDGMYALIMDDQGVISRHDEANDRQKRNNFMMANGLIAAPAPVAPR